MFSKLFKRAGSIGGDLPEVILGGAYRRHRAHDIERFTQLAREAYPEFADRIQCFGADWAGNQFATDTGRIANGQPQVLLLEPGTGEALKIPASIESFHEEELASNADAAVGFSFFQKWLAAGGTVPEYDQCVGYKLPLFLGGEDEVTNLELGDFEVYWSIAAQILGKVRGLPPGTRIGHVSIDD